MGYAASDFGTMVDDAARRSAYLEAIERHVTPQTRVLDLGCGFGFFTLAALSMGAREVVGVEVLDAVRLLPDVIRANGYEDRAQVHQGDVRELDLGRFDLIISDLRGSSPLFGEHLDVVAYANEHLLADGGRLLPQRDGLCAALVSLPEWFEKRRRPLHVDGHDWSAVESVVLGEPVRVSEVAADSVVSSDLTWSHIEYGNADDLALRHRQGVGDVEILRSGSVHGIVAWFDAVIDDGLEFSTRPGDRRPTYGRMVYPFVQPIELSVGERVRLSMGAHKVGKRWVWEWAAKTASDRRSGTTLDGLEIGSSVLRSLADEKAPTRLL